MMIFASLNRQRADCRGGCFSALKAMYAPRRMNLLEWEMQDRRISARDLIALHLFATLYTSRATDEARISLSIGQGIP